MSIEPVVLPHYSGPYTNTKLVRTADGVFYTGMTLNDAKMLGRDKCVLRRDFSNLDKNKDNILTNDEIMDERDRQAHMLGLDALVMGLFALDDWVRIAKGRRDLFNFCFAVLFTAFTVDSLSRKKKLQVANEEIKRQLSVQG